MPFPYQSIQRRSMREPEISAGSGLISAFNEVLDERVKIAVQKELNQRRNH